MLGQLPASLDPAGQVDTLVRLRLGQDLRADADRIASLTLRLLLSASTPDRTPPTATADRVQAVSVNSFWDGDQLFTLPPTTDTVERLRVRVNNFPLTNCRVEAGWFVFDASPDIFAVGENLIGISLPAVTTESSMTVEKLEAHVLFSV